MPGCHRIGLALSIDLDPDYNFYPKEFSCEYYTEITFSDKLTNIIATPEHNLFSLIHLNMRSLTRNYANLTNLLANVDTKFSVIGITETWLQNVEHTCSIEGYHFVHNHRQNRIGGGVGIYLDSNMQYRSRDDISFKDSLIESLFMEIQIVMTKFSKENKLCYLMGDFNLITYHRHQFYK